MSAEQVCFTVLLVGLVLAHAVHPSKASFIISTMGVVVWLLSGWFWIVVLA